MKPLKLKPDSVFVINHSLLIQQDSVFAQLELLLTITENVNHVVYLNAKTVLVNL